MEQINELESLKGIVSDALSATTEVPESLRSVAFEKAFDFLLEERNGKALGSRRTPVRQTSSEASSNSARDATKRQRSSTGPKQLCSEAIEQGFFDEPRTIEDIREHLKLNFARNFESKQIATAVMRLVREGNLRRQKNDDGKYAYQRA